MSKRPRDDDGGGTEDPLVANSGSEGTGASKEPAADRGSSDSDSGSDSARVSGSTETGSGSDSDSSSDSESSDDHSAKKRKKEKERHGLKEKKDKKDKKQSKRSKKESKQARKKKEKKEKKHKKEKKEKFTKKKEKGRKHKRHRQPLSAAEVATQAKIDALDARQREFAAAAMGGGRSKLSEVEQASLLHADLATRAASLGLPKGLIRTTGGAGSGLFSGGTFGDETTKRQLSGGFKGGDNPATAARMKREYQAQKAESRARAILEERAAERAANGGAGDTGGGTVSIGSRFGAPTFY